LNIVLHISLDYTVHVLQYMNLTQVCSNRDSKLLDGAFNYTDFSYEIVRYTYIFVKYS